jgi:SAM-dependent methyltransferase
MASTDDALNHDDYRGSHLAKGGSYDADLAGSPFDAYMSHWEARHVPAIVKRLYPQGVPRYLDFACGTGRVTRLIAPEAQASTGVDISPTMLEQARRKCPQTRFHLGDITAQDPDLGQFDLISSFRFFGNAQDELREAALQAITKRLASGGHLLINNHRNPHALYARLDRLTGGDAAQVMDLHLPKLRRLLQRHGLQIVLAQPIGAWLYRARLMYTAQPDDARALRNEARFSAGWLAPIAPDMILAARKG